MQEVSMRKFSVLALIAILSIVGDQLVLPVSAQPTAQRENVQPDPLLPPRVERVTSRPTLLRWGMPQDEVERIMGSAADVTVSDIGDYQVRLLRYRLERMPIKITISNGKLSGVTLDIAAIDDREVPAYARSVWPGMHRMAVLWMIGEPSEHRFHDGFGIKLEHMVFERPGQPDLSIILIDGRVATKKVGRALPPDILNFSLPLAPAEVDQIRVGMSLRDVQALFGAPKHVVRYAFLGRPAEYRIYETGENGSFGCFTFIDEILVGFSDGGRFSIEQILSGG
jgi:hypothetical protein